MKTFATIGLVTALATLTAGCLSSPPSSPTIGGQMAATGQTTVAAAASGFISSGTTFACTGGQLTVSGDGGSITLVGGGATIAVQGGPLVYTASGNVVVFDNANYQRFRVLNGATLVITCTA